MRKLKEVFIFNETYPLPEDAYNYYKGKVMACSKNPMCLNNVKADVEGYIAKWGKKSGIKIEEDDESSFIILKDNEDFDVKQIVAKAPKIDYIKVSGFILAGALAFLAIKNKSVVYGIITIALLWVLFHKTFRRALTGTAKETKETETVDVTKAPESKPEEVKPAA